VFLLLCLLFSVIFTILAIAWPRGLKRRFYADRMISDHDRVI